MDERSGFVFPSMILADFMDENLFSSLPSMFSGFFMDERSGCIFPSTILAVFMDGRSDFELACRAVVRERNGNQVISPAR